MQEIGKDTLTNYVNSNYVEKFKRKYYFPIDLKILVERDPFLHPFDKTNDDVAIVHAHRIRAKPLDSCSLTHLMNSAPAGGDFEGMKGFETSLSYKLPQGLTLN